jgi:hypothetical protein
MVAIVHEAQAIEMNKEKSNLNFRAETQTREG